MHIAHVVHRYPPALGGAEAYFARLSEFMALRGHDVTVLTTSAQDVSAFWSPRGRCFATGVERQDGVSVHRYPLWRMHGRRWLLKPLSMWPNRRWQGLTMPCNPISFAMAADFRKPHHQYDVVHASAFPYAFPIIHALDMARRLTVPFYLTPFLHLGDPDWERDPIRLAYTAPPLARLLREADMIFAQTPSERDAIIRLGVRAEHVVLQGMGVDRTQCMGGDRQAARQRWNAGKTLPVIGHLANNSVEKGTVDLLVAAKQLWEQGEEFLVVLAGPEMPNFESYWKGYDCKQNVRRLGALTESEKRDFFAGIDVFALPSRSDSFGIVLLEAWANGVPNVAYRAGGIADVVKNESDGLLVPCGDRPMLADALRSLVKDRTKRRKLGDAGQARIEREFEWTDRLEIVHDHYVRSKRERKT